MASVGVIADQLLLNNRPVAGVLPCSTLHTVLRLRNTHGVSTARAGQIDVPSG